MYLNQGLYPSNGERIEKMPPDKKPFPEPRYGSKRLKRLVLKATSYHPGERFESPQAMLRELQQCDEYKQFIEQSDNDSQETVSFFSEEGRASARVHSGATKSVEKMAVREIYAPAKKPLPKRTVVIFSAVAAVLLTALLSAGLWFGLGSDADSAADSSGSAQTEKIIINEQPESVITKPNKQVVFRVVASGTGLQYQWYYKKKNGASWSLWRVYSTDEIKPPANSTWDGKNSSKVVTLPENRNKQKFNDNTLGVDYSRDLGKGTLSLGLISHIDIYNYYGGWNRMVANPEPDVYIPYDVYRPSYNWDTEKQTFFNINVNAGWKSQFMLRDNPLDYSVGLQYGHASHDKPFNDIYKKGAHDNWGIINLEGSYDLTELTTAALGIKGEYLRRGAKARSNKEFDLFDEVGMITLSPTYTIRGDMFKLQLGLNGHICFSDGAKFRLSPNVRFNLALVNGFSLFANALGGKVLGYRQGKHFVNYRYDNPLLLYGSVYTPIDAEAGVKIGPFQGLSAKLSLGYGIVKDEPGIIYTDFPVYCALDNAFMSNYNVIDSRGYYINAEVTYKYRKLIEATASVKHAPHDNELYLSDKRYNGYKLGVDRASTVANIDIKVNPLKPLSVNLGLEYRGGRMALFGPFFGLDSSNSQFKDGYNFVNMDDVINLHAGANYRLNSNISVWLQAYNLLNRRYDILYGMGAQRIGVMGGASFTF